MQPRSPPMAPQMLRGRAEVVCRQPLSPQALSSGSTTFRWHPAQCQHGTHTDSSGFKHTMLWRLPCLQVRIVHIAYCDVHTVLCIL